MSDRKRYYDLLFEGRSDSLLYFITAFNYQHGDGTSLLLEHLRNDGEMDRYLLANRMIDKANENESLLRQWRALSQEQKLDFIIQQVPLYLASIQNRKS